ncbi:MAG: NirD/YgiW/YdeI family stress tolerance protein [Pseudomonadota bacterium]
MPLHSPARTAPWIALASALVLTLASPAAAQFSEQPGSAGGPFDTAAAAREAPDEAGVTLTGRIVERLGEERYRFADATGEITLDIDDALWRGRRVDPETELRITGEVDRGLVGMDIWVRSIDVIQ